MILNLVSPPRSPSWRAYAVPVSYTTSYLDCLLYTTDVIRHGEAADEGRVTWASDVMAQLTLTAFLILLASLCWGSWVLVLMPHLLVFSTSDFSQWASCFFSIS